MVEITLEKMSADIVEIKAELRKITSILDEEFELSASAKKELKEARKEPLSGYVNHDEVIKEFT
ncbi:hypothetical protein J4419_00850 [Candidatus Woesearchaeota archaeon]|nr:hypothetical protein [Candidatus Woesearchaeota archaeon]